MLLTRDEGHSVEELPPVFRDLDGLFGQRLRLGFVALLVRMLEQLSQVVAMDGVDDVEEIVAVWHATLGQFRREVPPDLLVVLHHRPDLDDAQLVVEGHADALHLLQWQEGLLASQHFLQEVLVHHPLRRQVRLHWTKGGIAGEFTYSCRGSSGRSHP